MRNKLSAALFVLLSGFFLGATPVNARQMLNPTQLLPSSSQEKAELVYEDYFGDYFIGETCSGVDVDFSQDSPASLLQKLKDCLAKTGKQVETDLLIVAYGSQEIVGEYFAATKDVTSTAVLGTLPLFQAVKSSSGSKYTFTWVNPSYSHYVDPKEPLHFPGSPWRHLPAIGRVVQFF